MTNKDIAGVSLQRLGQGMNSHIEQGTLLAKGQDSIDGQVMQFSSLMSVMNDDFAVMNSMQQEYTPDAVETPVLDLREYAPLDEEAALQEEAEMMVDDLVLLDAQEQVLNIDEIVFSDIVPIVVADLEPVEEWTFEFDGLSKMDVMDPNVNPIPVQIEWLPQTNALPNLEMSVLSTPVQTNPLVESTIIELPTFSMVPEVVAQEVVQLLNQLRVQELVAEPEVPKLEPMMDEVPEMLSNRDVKAIQISEILDLEAPELESIWKATKDEVIKTSFAESPDVDLNVELPKSTPVQTVMNPVNAAIQTGNMSNSSTSGQMSAGDLGNSLQSITQEVEKEKGKENAPKMELPKKSFAQLLAESDEAQAEQMSFNKKLLRKLEMIINDPAGRLDVEIAQDPIGIQVKALVPQEVMSSLEGLEQEIQVALHQQGIDLSSFELYQKQEDEENYRLNQSLDEQVVTEEREMQGTSSNGGMLVNQRV